MSPPPAVVGVAYPDPLAVAARFRGDAPTAWGMGLPGIRTALADAHAADGSPQVALTFDACGGPGGSRVDAALLTTLRSQQIPATLFLNSRWIQENPAVAQGLAADPLFLLANHGTRHVPLSVTGRASYGIDGTRSADEAVAEIWTNHLALIELTGRAPRYFRTGTAHYDDVAVRIAHALNASPVGFSVNGDGGATFGARTVHQQVVSVAAGGIVLCHMNQPGSGTAGGIAAALPDLKARGVRFVHVDGRDRVAPTRPPSRRGPN